MDNLDTIYEKILKPVFEAVAPALEKIAEEVEEAKKAYEDNLEYYLSWEEERRSVLGEIPMNDLIKHNMTQFFARNYAHLDGWTGDSFTKAHKTLNFPSKVSNYNPLGGVAEIEKSLNGVLTKISNIKSLVEKWISYGLTVLQEVSFVLHVYSFDSDTSLMEPEGITLYAKIKEKKEEVNKYTEKTIEALELIDGIKEAHPNMNSWDVSVIVKEAVMDKIGVKQKSEDMYNELNDLLTPIEIPES